MDHQIVYTIAQLNSEAKCLLEQHLGNVCVVGELSNLARPASGHVYFTLKDANAQVRCAFFRLNSRKINFALENGQQVRVMATVSLYEGRGDYQLIVRDVQLDGHGALQLAFEKLKTKLAKEGLFDATIKKPIPSHPQCIGVVTSASGAAIRDILKVLRRRSPQTPVIIYPSLVQGNEAAAGLVKAITQANQRQECDLLILARGGGSLEDLWPFNEEAVARAIFASQLPIVSGVGHEVDITIADFVADHRAATPSAAAEFVSSDQRQLLLNLNQRQHHLTRLILIQLQQLQTELQHLQKRLRHPRDILQEHAQKLDQLEMQLSRLMNNRLKQLQLQVLHLHKRLRHPRENCRELSQKLHQHQQQLTHLMQRQLLQTQNQLHTLASKLNTLSPLATLERGYAIVLNQQQHALDSITQIKTGDQLTTRLSDGSFSSIVQEINSNTDSHHF